MNLLPQEAQNELFKQLGNSNEIEASPAGAILMGMSMLGAEPQTMQEVLYKMIMDVSEKAEIPLNKFILDTTLLQLSGEFENAPKVVPRRGKDSFSRLVASLVIASGSKLPVGFSVLPGNTSDSTTLPDVFHTVNRIADEGPIEFLNVSFHNQKRVSYFFIGRGITLP